MRIDRRRKLPATMILSALGYNPEEILDLFYEKNTYKRKKANTYVTELYPERLRGAVLEFDIVKDGKIIVPTGRRITPKHIKELKELKIKSIEVLGTHICDQVLACNVVNKETGEVIHQANTIITEEVLSDLEQHEIGQIETIYTNEIDRGDHISKTLREAVNNYQDPISEIFRIMRPGSPLIQTDVLFNNLFFTPQSYDLSSVGRMKLNHHLKLNIDPECHVLTREDVIAVMRQLIAIRNGEGSIHDVDNLGNRRVRSVGELAENQFRIGLVRIERVVKDRLNTVDSETLLPQEILNTKMIQGALQEFFGSSQLSQFMDQSNPLAEVTHKRRVSALGPGGLTRERAGFEVRDVHPTHYGRLCPVETPEGPNIGLINSLAIYARTDEYGFIETPYRRVENGKVTDTIDYLSAINEGKYVIAQASAPLDQNKRFVEDVVAVRHNQESVLSDPQNIDYMDVSPQQAMSVAAALVPFLEHDDANRALMGANMQRQAVPVIELEAPLVGTGMENVVARDSGACVLAKRAGVVESVHSGRIVVRVSEKEMSTNSSSSVVDIYNLIKYERSNQSTCINQRPLVQCGDRVIKDMLLADGHSVNQGDLALGKNIRIAFMPWNGYNYEDSILISERIAHEDHLTSIHIQELTCVALDTKLGPEEITPEIANVSEPRLSKLDASGIVHIGAEVSPGDVLVGKVTPKGETMLSPEDKLLRAIFGEKASDVKNTSLCVPSGTYGTVIDVQVAVRNRSDKKADKRAMEIEAHELERMKADLDEELRIVKDASYGHLRKLLIGNPPISGTDGAIRRKKELTASMLDEIKQSDWFDFRFADDQLNKSIENLHKQLKIYKKQIDARAKAQHEKIVEEDVMSTGALKKVKVYLAVKRYIQPGDKIAGRHGSKGVISAVMPVEDMPYDDSGEPVDMVLSPLGVPSRMNVGQILEAHLGLAAKELGRKVDKMVREQVASTKVVEFLKKVYSIGSENHMPDFEKMGADTRKQLIERLRDGVPMSTPVFDGCSEDKIKQLLKLADVPESGQITLYDGRTGDKYMRPITVGYMYMMKLNHLVDDKMHARSTGPYSLVTQQPLGGKSHKGGQRFGEMEVWALEAYGAAHILQEMLTVKSDNMQGRNRMYKNILDQNFKLDGDLPDSFQVLMREMQALGIHLDLEQKNLLEDVNSPVGAFIARDHKKRISANFDSLRIGLLAPETVRHHSYGEVKKPETINYRTLQPERDGLFCARIFGPIKDFECLCGKCKRTKQRGVHCDKCNVEVTYARVRRERMGHIELAVPVTHIWFVKSLPSRIGTILDLTLKSLEKVLYFESYIVTDPGLTPLKKHQLLTEQEYTEALNEHGDDFSADMGAEAVQKLLREMDLRSESEILREQIAATKSETKIKRLSKRLNMLEGLLRSGNKPEWMVLTVLAVLPPDLRPLIQMDNGRFASSDLNDLYRRVINRNNRLKRLLDLNAPPIIIRNEKRMLQEAVDALLDNGRRRVNAPVGKRRPLKSLADVIKGKQGRFRQNLLGKRVDYSGRSVIVVGPQLKLHQCGLPKHMALELFKPYVLGELMRSDQEEITLRIAKRMVERESSEVWDALAKIIHQHPVLLNRAPTLHRLGIQAFEPTLVEGKAIQLHPLVCTAFNADFDGDQMAVHVPLSVEAQLEARVLMMASNNILSPANGAPIIVPSQDMVLGMYYMTREAQDQPGEGMVFADTAEAERAYQNGVVGLQAPIEVCISEIDESDEAAEPKQLQTRYKTTLGRALLWDIVPKVAGMRYEFVNKTMHKKAISELLGNSYRCAGMKATVVFSDRLMYMGFKYSTISGASICLDDFVVPQEKAAILSETEKQIKHFESQLAANLLSQDEKHNRTIDAWTEASNKVAQLMMERLSTEVVRSSRGEEEKRASFNSVFMYADSGARGSEAQIRQLAGMRGLMAKPDGSIIETAITANFREGLSVLEYFISTHGARKGLADTALKTANAGYLTRRLVDVGQDVIVTTEDCGTQEGLSMRSIIEGSSIIVPLGKRILGRVLAQDVKVPNSRKMLARAGTMVGEMLIAKIEELHVEEVKVRTPVMCEARYGVCATCYGRDLSRGAIANMGEAVGIIAAQSIGEPGTQLTMRTFHIGGAASRVSAGNRIEVNTTGTIVLDSNVRVLHRKKHNDYIVVSRSGHLSVQSAEGREQERYKLPYGTQLSVQQGESIEPGQTIATWDLHAHPVISEYAGIVEYVDAEENITVDVFYEEATGLETKVVMSMEDRPDAGRDMNPAIILKDKSGKEQARYPLAPRSSLLFKDGDSIDAGDVLARIPLTVAKHVGDITGGLPRVTELFEARCPNDPAILAAVSGAVSFGKETSTRYRLIITPDDENQSAVISLVPKQRSLLVSEGEHVEKGDVIAEGAPDPSNILQIKGVEELTHYLVNEVQKVYRLQGVDINDKHIEIIVRQMLRKVRISATCDSHYLQGDLVEYREVCEENKKLIEAGKEPAQYMRQLLSITRASLSTESFISAASFQETTRVLTEASMMGRCDYMRGLKENVVVGHPIPAGTGMQSHKQYERMREIEKNFVSSSKASTKDTAENL